MPGLDKERERETRRQRINPRLVRAGWRIVPEGTYDPAGTLAGFDACALEEFPTDHGPADYALCLGGQILGVMEAKRATVSPEGRLTQAERYSKGVVRSELRYADGLRVPFLYSTNGEVTWFHDVRDGLNLSRSIAGYHSPAGLLEKFHSGDSDAFAKLKSTLNIHPGLRPYQREANDAIERALAERRRNVLVTMATGTGKTVTLVNQIYRLMASEAVRRVLFLVDRRVLAAQAVRTFAAFEAEPGLKFDRIYEVYSQQLARDDLEDASFDPKVLPASYLEHPRTEHPFVYVSTIHRIALNLFGTRAATEDPEAGREDDANQLNIPINAFDLVVVDECHRGYTSREEAMWRDAINHFDAFRIGLTATPALHTSAYFGEPVFRYEYERAVEEGYLVDYEAVRLDSGVRMNGFFLSEGERIERIDPETGIRRLDQVEDSRQVDTSEVEKLATAPDSNRRILLEFKKYAEDHEEEFGRFPKTLIFADNDRPHTSHADQIAFLAREIFNRGQGFVQKITGTVDKPLQRIREFRNRPNPSIAVTVDLMSTGVDIPDLEFIVFLRMVKSRILFEQMLGRGTRLGEKFPDKSHFVVFDCFSGTLLRYFAQATTITAEAPLPSARTIDEIVEDIWGNRDRDYNIRCLVKRLRRIDRQMSGEGRGLFSRFVPGGDVGAYADQLANLLSVKFADTMSILRDADFLRLANEYPRAKTAFLVAIETQDMVTSEWLIHGSDGQDYKPEDYLVAFAKFVNQHSDEVDAIRVLLDRPREWNPRALIELRDALAKAPQHFTLRRLQQAHAMTYQKALVDIISMVKHAAQESEPLLTAEERVTRAMLMATRGITVTVQHQKWLDRIRSHLIENLSIEKEDFDIIPVFARAGGWSRADRDFEGLLQPLLANLNEAIAA